MQTDQGNIHEELRVFRQQGLAQRAMSDAAVDRLLREYDEARKAPPTFKAGDRVVYTGKSTVYHTQERIGWMASVEAVHADGSVDVRFDTPDFEEGLSSLVFAENLAHVKDGKAAAPNAAEPAFKAGDRVVYTGKSTASGWGATVKSVHEDGSVDIHFDTANVAACVFAKNIAHVKDAKAATPNAIQPEDIVVSDAPQAPVHADKAQGYIDNIDDLLQRIHRIARIHHLRAIEVIAKDASEKLDALNQSVDLMADALETKDDAAKAPPISPAPEFRDNAPHPEAVVIPPGHVAEWFFGHGGILASTRWDKAAGTKSFEFGLAAAPGTLGGIVLEDEHSDHPRIRMTFTDDAAVYRMIDDLLNLVLSD